MADDTTDITTNDGNGLVIGTSHVIDGDDVRLIPTARKVIRMPVSGIPVIGRHTQGVSLVKLEENEKVAAVARVADVNPVGEESSELEEESVDETAGEDSTAEIAPETFALDTDSDKE